MYFYKIKEATMENKLHNKNKGLPASICIITMLIAYFFLILNIGTSFITIFVNTLIIGIFTFTICLLIV
jgi:hypothetical protein